MLEDGTETNSKARPSRTRRNLLVALAAVVVIATVVGIVAATSNKPPRNVRQDPKSLALAFIADVVNDEPDAAYAYTDPTTFQKYTFLTIGSPDFRQSVNQISPFYRKSGHAPEIESMKPTSLNPASYSADVVGVPVDQLTILTEGTDGNYQWNIRVIDRNGLWAVASYQSLFTTQQFTNP